MALSPAVKALLQKRALESQEAKSEVSDDNGPGFYDSFARPVLSGIKGLGELIEPITRPITSFGRGVQTAIAAGAGLLTKGDPLAYTKLTPAGRGGSTAPGVLGAAFGIGAPQFEAENPFALLRRGAESLSPEAAKKFEVEHPYLSIGADVAGQFAADIVTDPFLGAVSVAGRAAKLKDAARAVEGLTEAQRALRAIGPTAGAPIGATLGTLDKVAATAAAAEKEAELAARAARIFGYTPELEAARRAEQVAGAAFLPQMAGAAAGGTEQAVEGYRAAGGKVTPEVFGAGLGAGLATGAGTFAGYHLGKGLRAEAPKAPTKADLLAEGLSSLVKKGELDQQFAAEIFTANQPKPKAAPKPEAQRMDEAIQREIFSPPQPTPELEQQLPIFDEGMSRLGEHPQPAVAFRPAGGELVGEVAQIPAVRRPEAWGPLASQIQPRPGAPEAPAAPAPGPRPQAPPGAPGAAAKKAPGTSRKQRRALRNLGYSDEEIATFNYETAGEAIKKGPRVAGEEPVQGPQPDPDEVQGEGFTARPTTRTSDTGPGVEFRPPDETARPATKVGESGTLFPLTPVEEAPSGPGSEAPAKATSEAPGTPSPEVPKDVQTYLEENRLLLHSIDENGDYYSVNPETGETGKVPRAATTSTAPAAESGLTILQSGKKHVVIDSKRKQVAAFNTLEEAQEFVQTRGAGKKAPASAEGKPSKSGLKVSSHKGKIIVRTKGGKPATIIKDGKEVIREFASADEANAFIQSLEEAAGKSAVPEKFPQVLIDREEGGKRGEAGHKVQVIKHGEGIYEVVIDGKSMGNRSSLRHAQRFIKGYLSPNKPKAKAAPDESDGPDIVPDDPVAPDEDFGVDGPDIVPDEPGSEAPLPVASADTRSKNQKRIDEIQERLVGSKLSPEHAAILREELERRRAAESGGEQGEKPFNPIRGLEGLGGKEAPVEGPVSPAEVATFLKENRKLNRGNRAAHSRESKITAIGAHFADRIRAAVGDDAAAIYAEAERLLDLAGRGSTPKKPIPETERIPIPAGWQDMDLKQLQNKVLPALTSKQLRHMFDVLTTEYENLTGDQLKDLGQVKAVSGKGGSDVFEGGNSAQMAKQILRRLHFLREAKKGVTETGLRGSELLAQDIVRATPSDYTVAVAKAVMDLAEQHGVKSPKLGKTLSREGLEKRLTDVIYKLQGKGVSIGDIRAAAKSPLTSGESKSKTKVYEVSGDVDAIRKGIIEESGGYIRQDQVEDAIKAFNDRPIVVRDKDGNVIKSITNLRDLVDAMYDPFRASKIRIVAIRLTKEEAASAPRSVSVKLWDIDPGDVQREVRGIPNEIWHQLVDDAEGEAITIRSVSTKREAYYAIDTTETLPPKVRAEVAELLGPLAKKLRTVYQVIKEATGINDRSKLIGFELAWDNYGLLTRDLRRVYTNPIGLLERARTALKIAVAKGASREDARRMLPQEWAENLVANLVHENLHERWTHDTKEERAKFNEIFEQTIQGMMANGTYGKITNDLARFLSEGPYGGGAHRRIIEKVQPHYQDAARGGPVAALQRYGGGGDTGPRRRSIPSADTEAGQGPGARLGGPLLQGRTQSPRGMARTPRLGGPEGKGGVIDGVHYHTTTRDFLETLAKELGLKHSDGLDIRVALGAPAAGGKYHEVYGPFKVTKGDLMGQEVMLRRGEDLGLPVPTGKPWVPKVLGTHVVGSESFDIVPRLFTPEKIGKTPSEFYADMNSLLDKISQEDVPIDKWLAIDPTADRRVIDKWRVVDPNSGNFMYDKDGNLVISDPGAIAAPGVPAGAAVMREGRERGFSRRGFLGALGKGSIGTVAGKSASLETLSGEVSSGTLKQLVLLGTKELRDKAQELSDVILKHGYLPKKARDLLSPEAKAVLDFHIEGSSGEPPSSVFYDIHEAIGEDVYDGITESLTPLAEARDKFDAAVEARRQANWEAELAKERTPEAIAEAKERDKLALEQEKKRREEEALHEEIDKDPELAKLTRKLKADLLLRRARAQAEDEGFSPAFEGRERSLAAIPQGTTRASLKANPIVNKIENSGDLLLTRNAEDLIGEIRKRADSYKIGIGTLGGERKASILDDLFQAITKPPDSSLVKGFKPQGNPDIAFGPKTFAAMNTETKARMVAVMVALDPHLDRAKKSQFRHYLTAEEAHRGLLNAWGSEFSTLSRLYNSAKGADAETLKEIIYSKLIDYSTDVAEISGDRTDAARTLAAVRWAKEDPEIAKLPSNLLKLMAILRRQGVSKDKLDAIRDIAINGDPQEIMNALNSVRKVSRGEQLLEIWKAGLLSGPTTKVANSFSNAVFQGLRSLEQVGAIALDKIRATLSGTEAQRYWRELPAMVHGVRLGLSGPQGALADWTRDYRTSSFFGSTMTRLKLPEGMAQRTAGSFKDTGTYGSVPGKFGEIVRSPFKRLDMDDAFFKHVSMAREMAQYAAREAAKRGLDRGAQERILTELLDAGRDGVVSPYYKSYKDVLAKIEEKYLRDVFQAPLEGWFRSVQEGVNEHPVLQVFLPFVKTPANIALETIRRTPLALFSKKTRAGIKDFLAGNEKAGEGADEIAKMLMGTVIGGGLALLASDGLIQMTGGGPPDPEKNDNWQKAGNQPYSIRFGDSLIKYHRIEPLGSVLGLFADMREAMERGDIQGAEEFAEKGIASIQENLTSKTFLAGLEGLFTAWHDPKRYMKRFIVQLEGSLVPGIVASAARAVDPVRRKTEVGAAPIIARLPFASRTLRPQTTGTGEERLRPGPTALERLASPFDRRSAIGDPLAEVMFKADYVPDSAPEYTKNSRITKGQKVYHTKEEIKIFNDFKERATEAAKRLLQNPSFMRLPDLPSEGPENKQDVLKRLFNKYQAAARARVNESLQRRIATGKVPKGPQIYL